MLTTHLLRVSSILLTLGLLSIGTTASAQGPTLNRTTEWKPVRSGTSAPGVATTPPVKPAQGGLRETAPPRLLPQGHSTTTPQTAAAQPTAVARPTSAEAAARWSQQPGQPVTPAQGTLRLGPRPGETSQPAMFYQEAASGQPTRAERQPMSTRPGGSGQAETLPEPRPMPRPQAGQGVGPFWTQQPSGQYPHARPGTVVSEFHPQGSMDPFVEGDVIYEGNVFHEGVFYEGEVYHEPPVGCGVDGTCGTLAPDFYGPNCYYGGPLLCWPILRPACHNWCWTQDLTLFTGPHSFQGPLDLGLNGNFGFHYGINYAFPLWHQVGWGLQVGAQVAHSNLDGNSILEATTGSNADRTQVFFTAGLFRRAWHDTCGWQYGVAFDMLRDNYFDNVSLTQLRAEISRRWHCHEFGFNGVFGTREETIVDPLTGADITAELASQYRLFYRYHYDNGAETRFWVGATDDGDGLVGSDSFVVLNDRWALQADFNYLIPSSSTTSTNVQRETWSMNMNLVWFPGRTAKAAPYSRYRPLFNVANNSSMFIRR